MSVVGRVVVVITSAHLDFCVMRDSWLAILSWQNDLPDTERILLHWHILSVPLVCVGLAYVRYAQTQGERLTEVTNKECLGRIWSPFTVCDVVVLVDIEAELLGSLVAVVNIRPKFVGGRYELTLLNFSSPPSVSSIFWIQSCALLNRCLSASLNGDSQGSSLITPGCGQLWFV